MTAGEVNRELKALREADGRLADEFIAAGRGHERPSDYLDPKRTDDLSRRAQSISRRISALKIEVEMRAGPGFHELPYSRRRGSFGPRTKANPMKKSRHTKRNPIDSTHLHLIRVDYVGATNTRGSRIKLTSLRFPKNTYSTGYDSVYGSTLDQADDILKGMGYTVAMHGELPRGFIVGVRQFEPLPRKGGTIAKRNPFRRAATALVSYRDGARTFYAVRHGASGAGQRIGFSTSHAMATPFPLKDARTLKGLLESRGHTGVSVSSA